MAQPIANAVNRQTQGWGVNGAVYGKIYIAGCGYLKGHDGNDFGARYEDVYSVKGGVVSFAAYNYGNYGHTIGIRHPDGTGILYCHLSEFRVMPGQLINEGQKIGVSGNSGNSTAPHLHLNFMRAWLSNLCNGYYGSSDVIPLIIGSGDGMPTQAQFDELNAYADQLNGYASDGIALRFIGRRLNASEMRAAKLQPLAPRIAGFLSHPERRDRIREYYLDLIGREPTADELKTTEDLPMLYTQLRNTQAHKDYLASLTSDEEAALKERIKKAEEILRGGE